MAFVERTSRYNPTDMNNNPWWYSNGNIYYAMGSGHPYGLPNCTCYCYGRTGEINGAFNTNLPAADAGNWYDRVASAGTIPVGYTPKLGGIMVFHDRPGATIHKPGHVAQVEHVYSDGSVMTSNSAYGGTYFYRERLYPANGYLSSWMHDGSTHDYVYQGCIYVYNDSPTPPQPPLPSRNRKMPIWMLLKYWD